MKKKLITRAMVCGSIIAAAIPMSVWAEPINNRPDIPNAGTILNELEPERHVDPHPPAPEIDNRVPETKEASQSLTAAVHRVVFECAELDINDSLQFLTKGRLSKSMTFEQMHELALAATEELRRRGYMTSIVYVPAQDLDGGVLRLKAIIGRYGDVEINNRSQLTDERLLGYAYPVRPGQLIKTQPLNKSLLILNEIPGMQVKSRLEPGKRPGTAKIIIDADVLEKQGGYVYVDNYGSKSTGKWRYGLDYHRDNLSKVGDQLDIAYMASTKDMDNYQLRYNLPVGRDGALWHNSYSRMSYELGDSWAYLNGSGKANTLETGITIPMKLTLRDSSWYDITYRSRGMTDDLFGDRLHGKKSSDSVQLEIHGYDRRDRYSDSYSLSHTMGNMGMDSEYSTNTDLMGTAGWYSKTNATLYHIQRLNNRWQMHASLIGQYAWDNLDSSEDLYIGGASGVRAFSQGEAGGDSGLLGTLEFRYTTGLPELQLTGFVDAGRVFYNNHSLAGDPSENTRSLAGIGLGAIYSKSRDWYAKLDWATPLGNHYSSSEGKDIHNTVWLRVVKQL